MTTIAEHFPAGGERRKRGALKAAISALPLETMTSKDVALALGVSAPSVRATVSRLGRKLKARKYGSSPVRLHVLIRRAYDAMTRREPDGVTEAEWDQLLADMANALGGG